jgi:two-component sensor histidine kinase/sensor domain CHASE-containing protein
MRRRILLVIGGALLAMIAIITAVTRLLLTDSFERLERSYLERDMGQITNAIEEGFSSLESTGRDWASWNATWRFMQNLNPDYIENNINPRDFENLKLSIMTFVDTRGRQAFGRAYDTESQSLAPMPESLAQWLAAHPGFVTLGTEEGISRGIIRLPEGPLMAVVLPILHSDGSGPIAGTLLLGRYLSSLEATRLAYRLKLALSFIPLGGPRSTPLAEEAARSVTPENPVFLDLSRDETAAAYAVLRDTEGAPVVALQLDTPRDIHSQGERTARYFYIWMLIIGVLFSLVMLAFIEKRIISRLIALSAGVLAVGTGAAPARRIAASGKDQIAYLGAAINGMLDALERSTQELRRSERRGEAFLDAVPDEIFRITRDGTILDARSPARVSLVEASENLLGRDTEEIISLYSFISPEHFERSIAAAARALDSGTPQMIEFHVDVNEERRFYEQRFVASGENEAIVLVREVTAVKRAEEARDKEVLLKEIHHRVKNNLQVISSLLALQASAAPDPRTRGLLTESRDRVKSMALIHEKLYQSGAERGVSFAAYVRDLAAHLRHSYAGNSESVTVDIDVEAITLDMDVSVPFGLIINELLSNALKYAFPEGRRGKISVRLRRAEDGTLNLSISDDGVGFPTSVNWRKPSTLGLRIVHILVEQLKGTLALEPGPGTVFSIEIPPIAAEA